MAVKTRFSVALDEQEHAELSSMAEKHRVSMAWLVRQAATEFRCLRHSLLIRQPICVRAATRTMTARLG